MEVETPGAPGPPGPPSRGSSRPVSAARPGSAKRPAGGYEGAAYDEEIMEAELARRNRHRMIRDSQLKYVRYPYALWFVGLAVMWFGLFLFYHLIAGKRWGGTVIESFTRR